VEMISEKGRSPWSIAQLNGFLKALPSTDKGQRHLLTSSFLHRRIGRLPARDHNSVNAYDDVAGQHIGV